MSVESVIKGVPGLIKEMVHFLLHPRQFVAAWKVAVEPKPKIKEFVGWTVAVSTLMFGLYAIPFGSPMKQVMAAFKGSARVATEPERKTPEAKPEIVALFWKLGIGVGVALRDTDKSWTSLNMSFFVWESWM